MEIKKARTSKKRTNAAANASGCGSSVAMAEMPPHGANHIQPPRAPLPPGVYFSPTREECLGFLNRRIAGDEEMADVQGYIFDANVYGESPDALRQRHPPASIRGRGEDAWWFLSETRFQSKTMGGGASKRADRQVQTGGYWRLEQGKEKLEQGKDRLKQSKKRMKQSEEEEELEEAEGVKNCFGFYVGPLKEEDKTPWLMQEFTSANDDGAGKMGVAALYRVYVTPRATTKQLKDVFGEDGVKKEPNGKKRPARAMVLQEYFDRIAERLPEGSVRVVVQEHVQAPQPPPPVAPPVGPIDYNGQHGQYLGQYEQQHGQYHGQYEQQHGQYHGQYEQQGHYLGHYQNGQYLGQYEEQHGHYLGQHEQQQGHYLGHYQQQHGPFPVAPLPPPASPGLLAELAAEAPQPDNLSMSMVDFMRMMDEQPAEMVNEQPAVTVKGEEEPNWESLHDIVDADEFKIFSKEG